MIKHDKMHWLIDELSRHDLSLMSTRQLAWFAVACIALTKVPKSMAESIARITLVAFSCEESDSAPLEETN